MAGGLDELSGTPRFGAATARGERTLAARIHELGPRCLEPAELLPILEIVLKACEALARSHERGVIHGALTPSCVVLGHDDEISVRQHAERPELASVAYYSTEQAWGRGNDLDARTDVYGFGGILFLLLTLRAPHACHGDAVLELASARQGAVSAPQMLRPDRALPRTLCSITMRALAASPNDRFPSIALLKQALERFVHGWVIESGIDQPMRGMPSVSIERALRSLLI